jgi:hypothetical protein
MRLLTKFISPGQFYLEGIFVMLGSGLKKIMQKQLECNRIMVLRHLMRIASYFFYLAASNGYGVPNVTLKFQAGCVKKWHQNN